MNTSMDLLLGVVLSSLSPQVGPDGCRDGSAESQQSTESEVRPAITNCAQHPFVKQGGHDAEDL